MKAGLPTRAREIGNGRKPPVGGRRDQGQGRARGPRPPTRSHSHHMSKAALMRHGCSQTSCQVNHHTDLIDARVRGRDELMHLPSHTACHFALTPVRKHGDLRQGVGRSPRQR
ncbi:hypothetical protein GBA52_002535 [Prunus armeniaca]|nr:hypothetical protein GBA52_002535 [Prunus armeniaca]